MTRFGLPAGTTKHKPPDTLPPEKRSAVRSIASGVTPHCVDSDRLLSPTAFALTENPDAPRATFQQDLWHYTISRMVDACVTHGVLPYYGPFGDIGDPVACEAQFRNAYLLGCVGAWSLHPSQIDIAKCVFSLDPKEVAFAKRIVEAMPDGTGAAMIDGKMQDDATWKQAKVILDLARLVATRDPERKALYGL